jgi:hypothetical protein
MKGTLITLAAATLLVAIAETGPPPVPAAPASSAAVAAPWSRFLPKPPFAGPREILLYGHIRSLARKRSRYRLRVDPALWLSGTTADQAAIDDGVIRPGETVPNDFYVREGGHRLLTYRTMAGAHATVITNPGGTGIRSTAVPVSELAQIVKGRNPRHRALFEPDAGFWIHVASDTVRALDQQYEP